MTSGPFTVLRPAGQGGFILLCDHAANHVPAELNGLGLRPADLARHIAWDIGAGAVTALLSDLLDAPAILATTSRLVIDCNRHCDAGDLIPEISDGTPVPGNLGLSEAARAVRIRRWHSPYHDAVEALLDARPVLQPAPVLLSVHSMAASLAGNSRPWQIALSSHGDRHLVEPMLAALRRRGDLTVGDNQPYRLDPAVDFTIPRHAMRRNWPYLQVEFRQDEVADPVGQRSWAQRFVDALSDAGFSKDQTF